MNRPRRLKAFAWLLVDWLTFAVAAGLTAVLLERQPEPQGVLILSLMAVVRTWVFVRSGMYRAVIRYSGMHTLAWMALGVGAGSVIGTAAGYLAFLQDLGGLGRKFLVLEGMLVLTACGGARFLVKAIIEARLQRASEPVLVLGTGEQADLVVRALRHGGRYRPVGLLADRPEVDGELLQGLVVLGNEDDLPRLHARLKITTIVVACDLAPERLRILFRRAMDLGIRVQVANRPATTPRDRPNIEDLALEDLLRRPARHLDPAPVRTLLTGRTVLVTGAGGSIGSDLCRQIAGFGAARILLLEASEAALYLVDQMLQQAFPHLERQRLLLDLRDGSGLADLLAVHRPEVVFHAAAYKHVPLVEENPFPALLNNLGGFNNLLQALGRLPEVRLVLISTDKAVRPSSLMGVSKRICELLLQAWVAQGGHGCVVRFGNVLGSSGSVVPLFLRQIAAGGPLTVTDPEVTRFFMLIPEAVELVLHAAAQGQPGDLFLLDMGQPVKIDHLARQLIYMTGRVPDHEVRIAYTGLRPGEKLQEELLIEPGGQATAVAGVVRAPVQTRPDPTLLQATLTALLQGCRERQGSPVLSALQSLVPEWHPSASVLQRLRPSEDCR